MVNERKTHLLQDVIYSKYTRLQGEGEQEQKTGIKTVLEITGHRLQTQHLLL